MEKNGLEIELRDQGWNSACFGNQYLSIKRRSEPGHIVKITGTGQYGATVSTVECATKEEAFALLFAAIKMEAGRVP